MQQYEIDPELGSNFFDLGRFYGLNTYGFNTMSIAMEGLSKLEAATDIIAAGQPTDWKYEQLEGQWYAYRGEQAFPLALDLNRKKDRAIFSGSHLVIYNFRQMGIEPVRIFQGHQLQHQIQVPISGFVPAVLFHNEHLYVLGLNGTGFQLYKLDGQGPGEFSMPLTIVFYKEKIYISDFNARKILVFDEDLNFLRQHIHEPVFKDMVVVDDHIFLSFNGGARDHMIQKRDLQMKLIKTFVKPLDRAMVGAAGQGGHLTSDGTYLYYTHDFYYQIEKYNTQGERLQTWPFPVQEKRDLLKNINTQKPNWHLDLNGRMNLINFKYCGNSVYTFVNHYAEGMPSPYIKFNPKTATWQIVKLSSWQFGCHKGYPVVIDNEKHDQVLFLFTGNRYLEKFQEDIE